MSLFEFQSGANLLDALHFHLGRCDELNMTIGVVGSLHGVPDREDVAVSLADAVDQVPRLRQTLHPKAFGLRRPRWTDYSNFDLAEHFDVLEVPDRQGPSELLRTVDELQSKGFDPARPLWRFRLLILPGQERSLWHLAVHHAMADGATVAALLRGMFSRDPVEAPPAAASSTATTTASPGGGETPAGLRASLLGLAGELKDTVDRPPDERCAYRWSRHRRSATFLVDRRRWQGLAGQAGGSPNDLFLAHAAHWLRGSGLVKDVPGPFRTIMPVNVRTPADKRHFGNVTGGGCLFLDGTAEHLSDLRQIRSSSREAQEAARRPPPALRTDRLLDFLPGRVQARATQRRFAKTDLLVTNVAVPGPLRVGGLTTEHVVIQPTVIGSAASVALTQYGQHLGLTVNFDSGIVSETTAAVTHFEKTLEELVGSGEVWTLEDTTVPDGKTPTDSISVPLTDTATTHEATPVVGMTATGMAYREGRT